MYTSRYQTCSLASLRYASVTGCALYKEESICASVSKLTLLRLNNVHLTLSDVHLAPLHCASVTGCALYKSEKNYPFVSELTQDSSFLIYARLLAFALLALLIKECQKSVDNSIKIYYYKGRALVYCSRRSLSHEAPGVFHLNYMNRRI